jgi:hypothetical protein
MGVIGSPNLDPTIGYVDTRSGIVWKPFRAVDGTAVNIQVDPTFQPGTTGGNSWLNPYYNSVTTNEITGRTSLSGQGSELLEVQTGLESSGLGCGQTVQPIAAGKKVPQCWIVIVPRADATTENTGTPFENSSASAVVSTSPLYPKAWQNRIAIPIQFLPVDSPCSLNRDERRLVGTELARPAIASWQPTLCTTASLPPYSFAPVSDASARQQLATLPTGGAGMIVVSKPLSSIETDPKSPAVYAPISASGLVIGFNVERYTKSGVPDAEIQLSGQRVAHLKLTPRLVAKLLTQSYRQQVSVGNALPDTYTWATPNPLSIVWDPDFLRFNPEFNLLNPGDDRTLGGLQLPAGTSDAAQQVWNWLLADPEAHAWLDGQPDDWGMKVNPVYSTNASVNPTGFAFATPVPSTFPKADPYCYQALPRGVNNSIIPPPICGTDWMPYSGSFADTAKVARIAFDGARIVENPLALNSSQVWGRGTPQYPGKRAMLSLTDTPSAARFGLQIATLSRAGDDADADHRQFIAPDQPGLLAGVQAMVPSAEPSVLEPAPPASAPGAYPLTTLTYAAIKPLSLDAQARTEYAAFLDYASGPGQVVGQNLGQLPPGYVPLPDSLRAQTAAAAETVRTMVAPVEETTTTSTSTTTTTVAASPPVASTAPTPPRRNPTVQPASTTPPAGTTAESTVPVDTQPTSTTAPVDTSTSTVPATSSTTTTTTPQLTPGTKLTKSRYAMAGAGALALMSALGALEITKRTRRSDITDLLTDDEEGDL